MKTWRPFAEVLQEKHLDMHVSPMENSKCAAFKEYEEVLKAVPLNFTEDDVTLVASNLSGAADALGAESIELINWLLRFWFTSEELRVVINGVADWMSNSSPSWATYHALIECCLVALYKRPGVLPVRIRETVHRDLAKLVMRAAGDQAKTACGNLQLCVGLEAVVEGTTHTKVQRLLNISK